MLKLSHFIKISNNIFIVENFSTQLSTGSHAIISITINTLNNPTAYSFFTTKYDNSTSLKKEESSFDIEHFNHKAYGCLIKSIDLDNMNYLMHLNIISDYFMEIPISERRDQIITDILNNNNFNKK